MISSARLAKRPLALLFLVSLGLRALACGWVTAHDVPLLFDERDYFARAVAWQKVYLDLFQLEAPPREVVDRAYGSGFWPPLHPMTIGAAMTLTGPTATAARLLTVLISALTTLLVVAFCRRVAGSSAALTAGWLHAVYPTFVAFSHYLWSETLFAALLLSALLLAAKIVERAEPPPWTRAAALGALLGLATLTRAAGLPFLLALPIWLAWRTKKPGACLVALPVGLAVILPWHVALAQQEDRFVLLSTLGGYNLALGNHPDVPPGPGSSWGHEPSKERLRQALERAAAAPGHGADTDWRAAALPAVREEISQRPLHAAGRAILRLRMLWGPDFFPLRHLFHAVYPPLPVALAAWGAGLALSSAVASYMALLALVLLGLFQAWPRRQGKALVLLAVALGSIGPLLSIGLPRLHFPLLVLLLPAAAVALRTLRSCFDRKRLAGVGAASLLLLTAVGTTVPFIVSNYLLPSSYYATTIGHFDRWLGSRTTFSDRVVLRVTGASSTKPLELTLVSRGATLGDGSRELSYEPNPGGSRQILRISSEGIEPIEIEISDGARSVRVSPIEARGWRRWTSTGLEGVEVYWAGGGSAPPP